MFSCTNSEISIWFFPDAEFLIYEGETSPLRDAYRPILVMRNAYRQF